jgi:hypothetical protein
MHNQSLCATSTSTKETTKRYMYFHIMTGSSKVTHSEGENHSQVLCVNAEKINYPVTVSGRLAQ